MTVLIELLCFGCPVLSFLSLWYSQRAQKYIAESSIYKEETVRLMDFFCHLEVPVVVILLCIWRVVKLMDKENHPTTGLFVSVQSVSPLNGFICAVHGQSFSFLTVVVVCTWVTVGNHDRHY